MSTATRPQAQFAAENDDSGRFVRQESRFRDRVTADGSSGFRAEPGRYHLYVSRACPWAHRSIIVRRLKMLEDVVTMSVVDPTRDDRGWRFGEGPGFGPETVDFDHIKRHYYCTHDRINPTGIVPKGPELDLTKPHDRG